MKKFNRFAIYYTPEEGELAEFGARWLGWDSNTGCAVDHPEIVDLPRPVEELTDVPRKYGFHGTLKPPFRIIPGGKPEGLAEDVETLAARVAPVRLDGLQLSQLGGFVALTPMGTDRALGDLAQLAGAIVSGLDHWRAPLTDAELARRRAVGLTERQERNLIRWGYPYVMEEFRFHLTLTGNLTPEEAGAVRTALKPFVATLVQQPFTVDAITLLGEDDDGRFHVIDRHPLSG